MRILTLIIIIALISISAFSQEIITDLSVNVQKKEIVKSLNNNLKSERSVHVLLPFKDDFSKVSVFPEPKLWSDNYAFINNTYPINPITSGVATLDALNDSGMIYIQANPNSFRADYLTSQYIRLDSIMQGSNLVPLKVSDSLYFSFYYQPQGIGNKPEGHDSLVLEFFAPADSMWHFIWSTPGQSYQSFFAEHGVDFKQVMIPITDSLNFFHKDFKFRFYNLASVANNYEPSWAGNVDQWHLDYIYLNNNRNINDTVYEDVAFKTTPKSLLTKYQSVPWPHYSSSFQMNTTQELPYANLSSITKNVSRNFSIIDLYDNSTAFTYSGGNLNLLALETENFSVPVSYTYASGSADSAIFELRSIINTTPDINRNNDTVRYYQKFYNYYAYDDGTPENGYGLSTNNALLAYKFTSAIADTLKAIQMFFNQTYQSANQKNFHLTIWTGSTEPTQIIYQKQGVPPIFEDELNKYHTYHIDTPLVLSGTFFIGWQQTTNDNLNIGFDRNTNSRENIFYNVSGTWMNSMYEGSLMIRPVFGKMFNTSIDKPKTKEELIITLFPNPNSGILNFKSTPEVHNNYESYTLNVMDLMGRTVFVCPFDQSITLPSALTNGVYFYRITHNNTQHLNTIGKFILNR